MKPLVQHIRTTNDTNGNPRRLFLVMSPETGAVLKVLDEGYQGQGVLRANGIGEHLRLVNVDVQPSEYREFLKLGRELDKGGKNA